MSAAAMLELRGLSRRFGGLVAVNHVSFSVHRDEVFGLIGPNGAGKTTLFNVVTGLTPPSAGQLWHDGDEVTGASPYRMASRGVARTFQNIRLFAELSARENVMIARHSGTRADVLRGVLGLPPAGVEERAIREQAMELLALVGLADRAEVQARAFPYGDQRRLEIARALALEPQLLLLDEPAAGMGPAEKEELSSFIRRLRDDLGITILLIEHHVPLVMGLCDRVAVLDFGRLIALGAPAQVAHDPAVVEAYLGDEA